MLSYDKSCNSIKHYKLLAGVIGFEPMILISKTSALGQTKLYPNNIKTHTSPKDSNLFL